MKKAGVFIASFLCGIIALAGIAFIAPFIGFGGSYEKVCTDAANLYGLDIDDYDVQFQKNVVNAAGEDVLGYYRPSGEKQTIVIKTSWSRPMVIATIFHEFAHAAQHRFNLDTGTYNSEQHAEILSFSVMWSSKYWWNSLHLLPLHLVGKTSEYKVTSDLWKIMVTGATIKL